MRFFLYILLGGLLSFVAPDRAFGADYRNLTVKSEVLPEVVVPRVVVGGSPSFESAAGRICTKINAFYGSSAFRQIAWSLLIVCMIVGVSWRARGLMWGEEEIGAFITWLLVRIFFGMGCFFFLSAQIAPTLTDAINEVTRYMADPTALPPAAQARLIHLTEQNDLWIKAVNARLGGPISGTMKSLLDDAPDKPETAYMAAPANSAKMNIEGTMNVGFPDVNWDDGQQSRTFTQSSTYNVAPGTTKYMPLPPYRGYEDKYGLYVQPNQHNTISSVGIFRSRPLIASFTEAWPQVSSAATLVDPNNPNSMIQFNREVEIYKAKIRGAQSTYLRDYAAWQMANADWQTKVLGLQVQSASSQAEDFMGSQGSVNPLLKLANKAALPIGYVQSRQEPAEAVLLILDRLERDMDQLKADVESPWGGAIATFLVPLALGIVGFYVAITVWSLPLGFLIWSSLFWLPKELELSGVLKKSIGTIIVLLFIPVFATLVVNVSLGFVDAVSKASVETTMASSITGATTGMLGMSVAGSLTSGLGPVSTLVGLAGGVSTGVIGANSEYNVFTFGAWIVAFLFIIATPRIVSALVFGTGSIAETLMQKVPVGGGFSVAAVGLGAKGASGTISRLGGGGGLPK